MNAVDIVIVAVGKIQAPYLKEGITDYVKKLNRLARVTVVEINDEKEPERLSEAAIDLIKRTEGERILAKIPDDSYVIALAIEGKLLHSQRFANIIRSQIGKKPLVFLIGGSHGLSDQVMRRADESISFSRMTFPHQLMRLVLLEQLYRALR